MSVVRKDPSNGLSFCVFCSVNAGGNRGPYRALSKYEKSYCLWMVLFFYLLIISQHQEGLRLPTRKILKKNQSTGNTELVNRKAIAGFWLK